MDETSVGYHFPGLTGTVLRRCRGVRPRDKASLSDVRGHISFLATVADDPAVQASLPQVLLGNEHRFTRGVLQGVASVCPANVRLWRQKSAWNSHATMRSYLCLLAKCLGDVLRQRYVVLVLDTATVHIHMSIYKLARQKGIRLLYVPAKMTRYLQPCDTHVFSVFKAALKEHWRRRRAHVREGRMDTGDWLRAIFTTVTEIFGKDWSQAFRRTGISDRQAGLSAQVLQLLGWDSIPLSLRQPPSAREARCIFPENRRIDVASYVEWVPASQRTSAPRPQISRRRKLPPSFSGGREVQTLD